MNKSKSAKGITLIALIITIIVLVILAVVAINGVNNGGIIEHAQSASDRYAIEQEKEDINLAILEWQLIPANEREPLVNFLDEKFVSASESGDKIIVTMPSERKYEVENNQVSGPIGDEDPIELDVSYLIIDNKVALLVNSGVDIEEKSKTIIGQMLKTTFTSADEAIITLASTYSVKENGSEITEINAAISFINTYMLKVGNEFTTKEQTLAALAIYTANEISVNGNPYDMMNSSYLISVDNKIQNTIKVIIDGKEKTIIIDTFEIGGIYVKYDDGYDSDGDGETDDELYAILYNDSENGLQITSLTALGAFDPIHRTDAAQAILDFNNIVSILNTECEKYINGNEYVESARSFGSVGEYVTVNSDYLEEFDTMYGTNYNNNIKEYVFSNGDTSYHMNTDYTKAKYGLDADIYTINDGFWHTLTSESDGNLIVYVCSGNDTGWSSGIYIRLNNYDGSISIDEYDSYGVRPVLKLNSNVQFSGKGTQSDPYVVSDD